jgi:hypothetical protein
MPVPTPYYQYPTQCSTPYYQYPTHYSTHYSTPYPTSRCSE